MRFQLKVLSAAVVSSCVFIAAPSFAQEQRIVLMQQMEAPPPSSSSSSTSEKPAEGEKPAAQTVTRITGNSKEEVQKAVKEARMKNPIPESLEPSAEVKNVGKVNVTGSTSRVPQAPIDEEQLKRDIMRQLGLRPDQNVTIRIERSTEPRLAAEAEVVKAKDLKPGTSTTTTTNTGPLSKSTVSTTTTELPSSSQAVDPKLADATNVGAVKVTGKAEDFRDPTKTIIGAEQLKDPADRNLLDVLEKQSGIIVRDGGVSINGLPPSYTQVLYDGRKMPAGTSLSTLHPDEIERMEISLGADATQGAGGMAGTINVIPKKKISQRNGMVGGNASTGNRVSQAMFANVRDRFRNGSNYSVAGSFSNSSNGYSNGNDKLWRIANGPSGSESLVSESKFDSKYASLNTRGNFIMPDGSWLGLSLNMTKMSNDGYGESFFALPNLARLSRGLSTNSSNNTSMSPEITWDKTFNPKWSLKTSARYTDYQSKGSNTFAYQQRVGSSVSESRSDSKSSFIDASLTYQPGEGKQLTFGGSTEQYDDVSRSQTLTSVPGINDYFRLRETTRGEDALFVRWAQGISPNVGLNTGVRWTSVDMYNINPVAPMRPYRFKESFLTPSLNLTYRQNSQNNWSFNYSRTFQTPPQSNLDMSDGAPSISDFNRPLNTIYRGNSALKAEVTDSFIGTLSRRWTPTIDTNLNVSYRRLENPLSSIIFNEGGTWFSSPVNLDSTSYYSISMSGKYWRTFGSTNKYTVLVTPSFTRSWNKIDGIDTSAGGIKDFTPISAYLGVQVKNGPMVFRGRINYTSSVTTFGGLQTLTYKESTTSGSLSASWAATPKLILGADVSGIGASRSPLSRTIYQDGLSFESSESCSLINPMGPTASVNVRYRF